MILLVSLALADELPLEAQDVRPKADGPKGGFTFLGLTSTRLSLTDVTTTNPLVNGQLVGTLGGSNSTTTGETTGSWAEERVGAFFTYAPKMLDGRAALEAAFEIDFAFGDTSYSLGGNTGGAIGGDQVNLQTRRLAARIDVNKQNSAVVGLQFVGDGVNDPGRSKPDDLFRSGGKMLFWGTEMAGLTWYGHLDRVGGEILRYRAGGYILYEQGFSDPDDISLFVLDAQLAPTYATRIGAHGWFLRDRAGGSAGIIGTGPTSALSDMQGGPQLDFRPPGMTTAPELNADLNWLALDYSFNNGLDKGRFGATALAVANVGRLYVGEGIQDRDALGFLVDGEARARIAPGDGSVARAELLYTTGDNPDTDTYEGVITGNSYGIAATAYGTHGCLLLFPDMGAIDRQAAIVYDASGGGDGVLGLTGSVGFDPIPNRFNLTANVGHARSGGAALGTELGAKIQYKPFVLGTIALQSGYVVGSALPQDPWAAYLSFDWVVTG